MVDRVFKPGTYTHWFRKLPDIEKYIFTYSIDEVKGHTLKVTVLNCVIKFTAMLQHLSYYYVVKHDLFVLDCIRKALKTRLNNYIPKCRLIVKFSWAENVPSDNSYLVVGKFGGSNIDK